MEISGGTPLQRLNALVTRLNEPKTRSTRSDSSDEATASPDRVELSGKAKEIQQVLQAVGSVPDVREERVEALRAAIRNGTYQVSDEEISESLLRDSFLNLLV